MVNVQVIFYFIVKFLIDYKSYKMCMQQGEEETKWILIYINIYSIFWPTNHRIGSDKVVVLIFNYMVQ